MQRFLCLFSLLYIASCDVLTPSIDQSRVFNEQLTILQAVLLECDAQVVQADSRDQHANRAQVKHDALQKLFVAWINFNEQQADTTGQKHILIDGLRKEQQDITSQFLYRRFFCYFPERYMDRSYSRVANGVQMQINLSMEAFLG